MTIYLMKAGSANRSVPADLKVSDLFDWNMFTTSSRRPTHVVPSIQNIRNPGMDIHNSVQKSSYKDQ